MYSGTKNDRIGPNHYFEKCGGSVGKVGTIGFGLSKTRRKVFEAVEMKRLALVVIPHIFDRGQR